MPCVIVAKDKGIFASLMIDETIHGDVSYTPIFTKDHEHQYAVTRVTAFKNKIVASEFRKQIAVLSDIPESEFQILPLTQFSSHKEASYQEVLKSGLQEHAGYMIDTIPMLTNTMH